MRTKLFSVLLIPAIAAVVLGSLQVSSELAGVRDLGSIVTQVEVGVKVADLVHEVQRERELMAGFVATGRVGDRGPLDEQKRRVDSLVTRLQVVGARLQGLDELGRSTYREAIASVNSLRSLREIAETTRYSDQTVITAYSAMINTLLALRREVTKAATSRDVGNIASAADALGRAKEQVAQQHAVLLVASLNNELPPNDVQAVRVADSRYGAALAEFFSVASSGTRESYADTVTGPEIDQRERIKQSAVQSGVNEARPNINLQEWDHAAGVTADLINKVEVNLNGQLRGAALALREQAGADAVRDATILLGSLFATLLLVVVVARSMLVPLRILRNTAFDVADRRLPEAIRRIRDTDDVPDIAVAPVAVHTREEIGQVARAFDAVHGEAVRLAAEQSLLRRNVNDMFVNLSRRSQGLVERQLRLIDQLENTEQDPEQLGNLFQLDHLATRMRRNSENLLVLAGSELARRSTRPVPTVDVLRAAVSEVEEYQRIVVQTPPAVNVLGLAVNDLVHLVAELLDNATTFSPPESRVMVRSSLTGHGDLVIEIADQGVGMTYEQLVETNQRLAEPPVVDVAVSRRMGLFVVGRLAERHGVAVRLGGNDGEPGLTAIVTVPADLVQAGDITEFGPRTDQVPTPRSGEQYLPRSGEQYLPPQLPEQPSWHSQPDDWATANWPAADAEPERPKRPVRPERPERPEQQPTPYMAGETAPMHISMVDSMSGMDLFTPTSVPKLGPDVDRGHDVAGDRASREVFGGDYPPASPHDYQRDYPPDYPHGHAYDYPQDQPQQRGAWPDTDQDARFGQPRPATAQRRVPISEPVPQAASPAADDHFGAGGRVTRAQIEETTPIYEEMVSAWFRELAPPAPDTSRPAPNYVEPPPFEVPAMLSHQATATSEWIARHEPPRPEQVGRPEQPLPGRPVPAGRPEPASASYGGPPQPPSRPEPPARSGYESEPAVGVGGQGRHAASAQAAQSVHGAAGQSGPQEAAGENGELWRSPADEGWRAVSALSTQTNNGYTAAGLPKRKRGANLLPGAAGQPSKQETPRRSRSADDVRGRLANYQQGLRQGREFRRGMAHAGLEPGQDPTVQHITNEESK